MTLPGNISTLVVVAHDGVVVRLAGERHLVLRRGELLGQLHHVLVGLEIRIRLGQREQPAERATELVFGAGQRGHGGGIAGIGGRGA